MLGESRLLMDEAELRQGTAPIRNATVVASGHVVLLTMSTEVARQCFRGDVMVQLRGVAQARQLITSAAAMEAISDGNQGTVEENNASQVCHSLCAAVHDWGTPLTGVAGEIYIDIDVSGSPVTRNCVAIVLLLAACTGRKSDGICYVC